MKDSESSRLTRRPNLSNQVYDALRDEITSGMLHGGDRLVVEKLGARFGVSPTPVREALARLIQEGIVEESGPGRLRVVPLTEQYVLDTYWVRGSLEGLATELAAQNMTRDDLAVLMSLQERAANAIDAGDLAGYAEADRHLHRIILDSAGNSVLIRELDALQSHIGFIRDYSHRHKGNHLILASQEHPPLVSAMTRRDGSAARVLMESHIRNSALRIAELLKQEEVSDRAALSGTNRSS